MSFTVSDISFAYGKHQVLSDIEFELDQGQILGVLGPNGIGKTTLIKCVSAMLKPQTGTSFMDGEDVLNMPEKRRSKLISYVPQFTQVAFPVTVFDTVLMGRQPYMTFSPRRKDKEKVESVLESLGLTDLAFRDIMALSGGERQRVMIARAIAQEPKLILMDEPTASLDVKHQISTLNIIEKLAQEKNIYVLISIHDLNLASMFCNKIFMIKDGRKYKFGSTHEALTSEAVKALYGVQSSVQTINGFRNIAIMKEL